jgi:hypothetical protein
MVTSQTTATVGVVPPSSVTDRAREKELYIPSSKLSGSYYRIFGLPVLRRRPQKGRQHPSKPGYPGADSPVTTLRVAYQPDNPVSRVLGMAKDELYELIADKGLSNPGYKPTEAEIRFYQEGSSLLRGVGLTYRRNREQPSLSERNRYSDPPSRLSRKSSSALRPPVVRTCRR